MNNEKEQRLRQFLIARLKPVYDRYGGLVYSLCLRLLTDNKAAEVATVEVFVEFSKEMVSLPDSIKILSRLRELAICGSLARRRKRADNTFGKLFHSLHASGRRLIQF